MLNENRPVSLHPTYHSSLSLPQLKATSPLYHQESLKTASLFVPLIAVVVGWVEKVDRSHQIVSSQDHRRICHWFASFIPTQRSETLCILYNNDIVSLRYQRTNDSDRINKFHWLSHLPIELVDNEHKYENAKERRVESTLDFDNDLRICPS